MSAATKPALQSAFRPRARGWPGRHGGRAVLVEPPPEYRASTVQACGLWPFTAGTGMPSVGVPVGLDLETGAPVCCDPISWYHRAGLILNPSAFLQGLPHMGKSSLVCRWIIGLSAYGVNPLILGDLKPDYRDLVEALGGNIVRLGRGLGTLNPLDPGAAMAAAQRLTGAARAGLLADARGRRLTMLTTLIGLNRGRPTTDEDRSVLGVALDLLDEATRPGDGTIPDLARVLDGAADRLHDIVLSRGNDENYQQKVDPLQRALWALCDGDLGATFAARTSTPLDITKPLCIDISGIDESDTKLVAAGLLTSWSEGFGAIQAHHALADAGLEPQRHWFAVMDEMWRALRSARGVVENADALTRLNRNKGVGQVMVTHTLGDSLALESAEDREKAKGFAHRAGFVVTAGVPPAEADALSDVTRLSRAERRLITGWSTPPGWNSQATPPGRGNFLIKVGDDRPGIAFHLDLTDEEMRLHDTNKRWN